MRVMFLNLCHYSNFTRLRAIGGAITPSTPAQPPDWRQTGNTQMIKTSTLAGVATLALAALPMFALATAAHAAPVAVKVADIDTLSPAGAAVFEQRAEQAANRYCAKLNPTARLTERSACLTAVRAEMADKIEARNTVLAARQGARMAAK